jgi:signal transduction histidine kinase
MIGIMTTSGLITAGICALLYQIPYIAEHQQARAWYVTVALLFAVMLGVVFSVTFSKLWLKTADDLSAATKEVSRGNFHVKVSDKGHHGEFGALIRSFNDMTEELSNIEIFRNDFINYFSHEFKTPIVSIRGFAKQLKKKDLTDEEQAEYIQIIIDECDRLTRLSTNILLLSRFENQQIVNSPSTFFVDEQIRRCLVLLEKEWNEKNIELVLEMDEVQYTTNEEMLSLVWTNLLSNAIKFSPPGGKVEVLCDEDEEQVHVVISDDGIGMSPETQKHIFEKFYQGDTSHKSTGNGLGLALVKRIVDLCGGTIRVSSREGQGASFTVSLPKPLPLDK